MAAAAASSNSLAAIATEIADITLLISSYCDAHSAGALRRTSRATRVAISPLVIADQREIELCNRVAELDVKICKFEVETHVISDHTAFRSELRERRGNILVDMRWCRESVFSRLAQSFFRKEIDASFDAFTLETQINFGEKARAKYYEWFSASSYFNDPTFEERADLGDFLYLEW